MAFHPVVRTHRHFSLTELGWNCWTSSKEMYWQPQTICSPVTDRQHCELCQCFLNATPLLSLSALHKKWWSPIFSYSFIQEVENAWEHARKSWLLPPPRITDTVLKYCSSLPLYFSAVTNFIPRERVLAGWRILAVRSLGLYDSLCFPGSWNRKYQRWLFFQIVELFHLKNILVFHYLKYHI